MVATDIVHDPLGSRNQIGQLTAVHQGRGRQPWQTVRADSRGGRGGPKPSRKGPPFASALFTPCGTPLKIRH